MEGLVNFWLTMACCSRRRREADARVPGLLPPEFLYDPEENDSQPCGPGAPPGAKWQRLVLVIQRRRRTWAQNKALEYAKNCLLHNLDGPAKGFGRHVGRWAWREIRSSW